MITCDLFVIQQLGPLSDWWMVAMVGGIVLIDVILLTAWDFKDPLQRTQFNFTEPEVRKKITIHVLASKGRMSDSL